jgi:hypothetical protein
MTRLPRPARRLIAALITLIIVDLAVPGVLRRLETSRYEDPSRDFRFENSDLFGIGPLVDYLREHPEGRQPRVMFIGNSVTYGYGLTAAEAVPGQYQRLDRGEKLLNVGVNGLDLGSAYLITKATLGAVDHVYLLSRTALVDEPLIGNRIPMDAEDARRFGVPAADRLEASLRRIAQHWALYRDSYRLQAALFGTSSRQFIYLHKGDLARALFSVAGAQPLAATPADGASATAPMAAGMPTDQRLSAMRENSPPMLWSFAASRNWRAAATVAWRCCRCAALRIGYRIKVAWPTSTAHSFRTPASWCSRYCRTCEQMTCI